VDSQIRRLKVGKGRVRIRVMEEAGGKHIRSKSYRQDVDFKTACQMVESLSKKGASATRKSKGEREIGRCKLIVLSAAKR